MPVLYFINWILEESTAAQIAVIITMEPIIALLGRLNSSVVKKAKNIIVMVNIIDCRVFIFILVN